MALYKEYIELDEEFIPVFSDEVDRSNPKSWKTFIPHESFKNILNALIKALDRAFISDIKPLWMTGAYGTGKTLGAFVIKHILEDDIEEISAYFEKYPLIQGLYEKVKALKDGKKHLVVYKSSSSNINSIERLVIEVQQAIKKALEHKKYHYLGGRTFFDNVLQKLKDPTTTFNFQTAFEKHRIEYFPDFSDHRDIIVQLESEDSKKSYNLTERIVKMMEKEGFIPIQHVENLKDWIRDVISENKLNSIVFIWDEFTDYFRQNRAVSALQELAQFSSETPFYLFLITHRDIQQFSSIDDDARKVLEDRFNRIRFEMTNITMYHLMANAIKIKPSRKEEWKSKSETIWSNIERCASRILESEIVEGTRKEDLKKLIPMHPFSSYLLSLLSSNFSSNQRTMFRFLRESEPNNFKWFIEKTSIEDRDLLTADVLWDYFFGDEMQELPDRASRIINYYNSHKGNLIDSDDNRVTKAILLLIALNETLGGKKLLSPLKTNIEFIFKGTNIERKLNDILKKICDQKILNRVDREDDIEFAIPIMNIDKERLDKLRKETDEKYSFENVTKFGSEKNIIKQKIMERCELSGSLKARFELETSSIHNADRVIDRVIQSWHLEHYQVGVLLLFAKTDEDLQKIDSLIDRNKREASIIKNRENEINIILVNTNEAFSERKWNNFIEEKTNELYADEMKDYANRDYHAKRAEEMINEWLKKIYITTMTACFKGESKEIHGIDSLKDYLSGIVNKLFPLGPEKTSTNISIYKQSGYTDDTILMGMGESNTKKPYTEIYDKLRKEGFWDNPEMVKNKPDHPIAKTKTKVQELLNTSKPVSIAHIWEELNKPPFGYMPSPICAFLMGFLMKDYSKGDFYIDDETSCHPTNPQRIAKAVEAVMKALRNYESYKIAKMKPEHTKFCNYMKKIFSFSDDKGNSIRSVKSEIRRLLIEKGLPVWSLKYYFSEEKSDNFKIATIIELLCKFVSVANDESSNNDIQIAENIYSELFNYHPDHLDNLEIPDQLKKVTDTNILKKGLLLFIKNECSDLYEHASDLGIDDDKLLSDVKECMSEDSSWLWQEEYFKEVIRSLRTDYEILQRLNHLMGTSFISLEKAKEKISEKFRDLKVPLEVISRCDERSGRILEQLYKYTSERDYKLKEDVISELQYGTNILENDKLSLANFIKNILNSELKAKELDEIYNNLSNIKWDTPLSKFTEIIKDKMDNLETLKLRKMIVDHWKDISNSESPEDWSEKNGIPINWLPGLDDEKFIKVFDTMNNETADLSELNRTLSIIEQNTGSFAILTDKEKVRISFINSIAGDFAFLIDNEIPIESLKTEIRNEFGPKVYEWRNKKEKISNHIRRFFEEEYKKRLCSKVLREIDTLSSDEAKNYLKELVQKEPLVGIKILKNKS